MIEISLLFIAVFIFILCELSKHPYKFNPPKRRMKNYIVWDRFFRKKSKLFNRSRKIL